MKLKHFKHRMGKILVFLNNDIITIMAYKSTYTGAQIDSLLDKVNGWVETPGSILDGVTGQQIIDKINSVSSDSIVFTKFVDCQAGAGKTTE